MDKVILTGYVYEVGSNSRIANAKITVLRSPVGGMTFSSYQTYLTTNADENGNYSVNFDYDVNYKYLMNSSDNGIHFNSDYQSVNKGETQLNIPQYSVSYLSIHIKNVSPYDAYDQISIFNGVWYGTAVDTILFGQVEGGKSTLIVWGVTKNGLQQIYNHVIDVPVADTAFYNLNY